MLYFNQNHFVEFFCGSGKCTQVFQNAGWKTWSTDRRKRTGKCVPDFRTDFHKVRRSSIPFTSVQCLWASIPCQPFSYGAGDFYYADKLPTKSATPSIKLLKKCLELIEEISPNVYFIENPRGHLRYQKLMIDFLSRTNGMVKTITMGSYGFPTIKPSDIFTNALDWQPLPMMKFGKGAKNPQGFDFSNLTVCQRQETPRALAESVQLYCNQHFCKSL